MINKVYIIGMIPIEIDFSIQMEFRYVQLRLEELGFYVVNPMDLLVDKAKKKDMAVRLNIKKLLGCDAVYILPCIDFKNTQNVELLIALQLDLLMIQDVFYNEIENVIPDTTKSFLENI